MGEQWYTRIMLQDGRQRVYYSEQETAERCRLESQMIRHLRAVGLVTGIETTEGETRYSDEDVARLRRIRRLRHDLGVNLAGVEVILRLQARMEALQREVERLRRGE